jgi:predicted acylesterase/phospholipase RssA
MHSQNNTFYLGICMAGAVSAGAYTAGVMDYLIEALSEWEKRKKENTPNTPKHNVVIPVLGGASAGGMTAVITAAALNSELPPVYPTTQANLGEIPGNKLYHSWVDLTGTDVFRQMMNTDDLQNNKIVSLLNSSFIDKVAQRAITPQLSTYKPTPPFFHPATKIFTTLTNLKGYGFNIGFKAGLNAEKYYMSIHNDYACFKLNNSNPLARQQNSVNTPAVEDGWMELDFISGTGTETAKNAAMATGAFPVGLSSRKLSRKVSHVNTMEWCRSVTQHFPVTADVEGGGDCETLNVDGGVINNEPFEKVRKVLHSFSGESDATGDNHQKPYQDPATFKSTVLMVDPFPSKKPSEFNKDQKLLNVIGLTFGAIMEQMRAKPEVLADAMSKNNFGQFLIAPARRRPNLQTGEEEDIAGDEAIACGALGGFAGFISKEFRIHDYFLGRHNCEVFLRDYFTIPEAALEKNEIFRNGYASTTNNDQFRSAKDGSFQIIPIFTPRPPQNTLPIPEFPNSKHKWPVITERQIDELRPFVKKRVKALAMNAVNVKGFTKFLLWIGSKVVLNRMLTNSAMNTIKKALIKHQLMQPTENLDSHSD